ncbi:uncharacterized protein BN778_01318 [Mycoplasma sp. CAG:776]|nr:uncharacterized protein BN778_01318 [Mycoplasma sp. CAG:776]
MEIKREIWNYLISEENIPEQYKPITMWGYLGYQIVFSIPIIGWIILLVFAFSKDENINIQNSARSYIIFLIMSIVLYFIIL